MPNVGNHSKMLVKPQSASTDTIECISKNSSISPVEKVDLSSSNVSDSNNLFAIFCHLGLLLNH